MRLAPFWRYYGGKNRAAKHYPQPLWDSEILIEPFAGAAGYACRYPWKQVVLVDRSPIICAIWRYLIGVDEYEIRCIPDIPVGGTVDDLPSWVPQEAKWLVGFWCNSGTTTPCKSPSARARNNGQDGVHWSGWGWKVRRRICSQLDKIRHWQVIEGEYYDAPDKRATWFIDPPYNNKAGRRYPHQPSCFEALGEWCRTRKGRVIVCENAGAEWLPFREFRTVKAQATAGNQRWSKEVIWTSDQHDYGLGGQRLFPWGAA